MSAANSVRDEMPSLRKIEATWLATVRSDVSRRRAMSRFDWPCSNRRATSRSEAVNSSQLAGGAMGKLTRNRSEPGNRDATMSPKVPLFAMATTSADRQLDADALWDGLASGRFTLLEMHDRGDRRILMVRENPAAAGRARALTAIERDVAERIARGQSNKSAAFDLAITASAVGGTLARALRKLGLRHRTDLARLLPPGAQVSN